MTLWFKKKTTNHKRQDLTVNINDNGSDYNKCNKHFWASSFLLLLKRIVKENMTNNWTQKNNQEKELKKQEALYV